MTQLSIIVPIYNVEPYLRKCVDSLLTQDLPAADYEIILVDDGSPDACPGICDEYARLHTHVRVIHRANGGLSAARNSGLQVAQGQYIMFVDSDDYLEPNVLGLLLDQCHREQLDVLRFDYQNVRLVGDTYHVHWPYKTPREVDRLSEVVDGCRYLNERMGTACYAVQFLVSRAMLTEGHLFFACGIHFEDTEWTPRMLMAARRVNATTTVVYNYLLREGSITKTGNDLAKLRKNIADHFVVMATLNCLLAAHPDCVWLRRMRSSMAATVLTQTARRDYASLDGVIATLRANQCFPLQTQCGNSTYLRRARLINISPRLFAWVINKLMK